MRRAIVLILASTVVACDNVDQNEQIRDDATASTIRSCAELETVIEQKAIREMNAEIDAILDGLDDRNGQGGLLLDRAVSMPSAAPSAPTEARDSATDFTTTNTQEKDVDEPDFVKNDGSRIFVLHGNKLVALAAWPADQTRIESVTDLEGNPAEMFLHKDRVIVFSQTGYGYGGYPPIARPAATETASSSPLRSGDSFTMTVYDVRGSAPIPLHRQEFEGRYVSARRTEDSVRTVSVAERRGPTLVYWPEKDVDWRKPNAIRSALEQARAENVKRIKAASLEDWLPRVFENGHEVRRECTSFSETNVSARLGFTTVSTLDLGALTTAHSTILNPADEVYASRDALYVTTRHYWTSPPSRQQVRQDHTYVFQFDIRSDTRSVRFVAGGGVSGHIVDPFALDEEGGNLRIATTRQTFIGWQQQDLVNKVTVLHANGGRLEVVGEVSGLARNERIYSARFESARGFLVTFRQVDPLFTLDLADPRQPRVVGELKVPGFSTYLHPLDRDNLLAIGRAGTDTGRIQGLNLQMFDVSRFDNPVVKHQYTLGSPSSSSAAEYDHKAFTYFASRGLLAIPFSDYNGTGSRFTSTLAVLRATPSAGIVPLGSIEHADIVEGTQNGRYPGWRPQVRRGVMMEDFVYSISYGGAKVHDLRDLSRPLVTLPFPR
jgi:hypothetical protein